MLIEFYKIMAVSKTVNWIFIIKCRPLCIVETILLKCGENYFLNEKKCSEFYRNIVSLQYLSSVQFSHSVVSNSLWPHESQHARPPCPSSTLRVFPSSCPSNQWCHPAISSSVVPFSFCPQSLPASGSFSMNQLFTSSGQSIWVSASASVLPMNTQDWSPCSSRDSLESSPTPQFKTINFFGTQLSSQSSSHIHTWPLEKP